MENNIRITRLETPLGPMTAGASESGICLLEFSDRNDFGLELMVLAKLFNAPVAPGHHPFFDLLSVQLRDYFEGKSKEFTLPLITPGSTFQQEVWKKLPEIPYGSTLTYKEQAAALNKPEAIRAVANANGQNRIVILIPCHRVIGSNGKLTGYAGGLHRKKWLLDLERRHITATTTLF